ncbi:hypothetical protein D3C86_1241970 [compost metagenome]
MAGLADVHAAYGRRLGHHLLVNPQVDVADPRHVLRVGQERVLRIGVGQPHHEVEEVGLQRVVADLLDDRRRRVVLRHVPGEHLVAMVPDVRALGHPLPAARVGQRPGQVVAALRAFDVGLVDVVVVVVQVLTAELEDALVEAGDDEVVEEVGQYPLLALVALAQVVALVAGGEAQVDTVAVHRRRAEAGTEAAVAHLVDVLRVTQTRVELAEDHLVAEVDLVRHDDLSGYRDRRFGTEGADHVEHAGADLLLPGRVAAGRDQRAVVVALLNAAVEAVLGEAHSHLLGRQAEHHAHMLHHRTHGQRLLHHQLGQPDLRALAHVDA